MEMLSALLPYMYMLTLFQILLRGGLVANTGPSGNQEQANRRSGGMKYLRGLGCVVSFLDAMVLLQSRPVLGPPCLVHTCVDIFLSVRNTT